MIAIVLGSIVGSGLLAWTAKLGCDSGLSSAGLMGATFGSHFARLPVILNIVQLIGWTTFELVVMRDGTAAIGKQSLGLALDGPGGTVITTLLWGSVLTLLLAGSMTRLVRKIIGRFGLPLVIASLDAVALGLALSAPPRRAMAKDENSAMSLQRLKSESIQVSNDFSSFVPSMRPHS